MIGQTRQLMGIALLVLLSNTAFGLAAVCAENAAATTSSGDLRAERFIWSHYDYWYSGLYVVGDRLTDEIIPADTGYSDINPAAQTPEDAAVMAGYPASWGMEAYLLIDCASSQEQAEAQEREAQDSATDTTRAPIALLCNPASDCAPLATSDTGQIDATDTPASLAGENESVLLPAITGIVHTAADGVLTIRTDTGRYATMTLPADARVERHTAANLDAVQSGDIVGAIVGGRIRASREAVEIRVYRGTLRNSISLWRQGSDTTAPAGFELRGVVRSTRREADGGTIRIGYATLDNTLQIAREIPVTIIEAAAASALKPLTVRVRAHPRQAKDGSLIAHAIDIL